ncbi:MAG: DUF4012 domain-containing protein [Acidimicrobiales bacterium]|nr:DUF4012 domain-containing protein [Acidimicrobiales bacterium]
MSEGSGTAPRGRRPWRWAVLAAVVVLVLAWCGVLAAQSISAYHHDQRGLAALEEVKGHLSPGEVTATASIQQLDAAEAEFRAAQSDLSSALFAPVTVVPVVGRQLRSVRALSSAAGTVSAVGSQFLSRVHGLLHAPHGAGPERVASLQQLQAASAVAAQQLRGVDTGPNAGLVSPLARKHNQFVSQLDLARNRLDNAAAVSAATSTILIGPQRYLVLAANNAEMRAGSGAFLDVGAATTSDGSVSVGQLEPSGQHPLPVGAVPVTGDLEHNWGWLSPSLDFRNLGTTPRFDVTAPLAAQMWTALTGQPVDGVIAVDIIAVQQLLEASGPVEVNGQTVSADTVAPFLLHDQYAGLTDNAADAGDRSDALGELARAVLSQLQGQSLDLTALAKSMSGAVSGRHLMVWSQNPAAEATWRAAGVSGSLTSSSLAVSLINLGSNKLDPFVPVRVSVATRPQGSNQAVTLTVTAPNTTPPGESQFIGGPSPGSNLPYGAYSGIVAVNVPGSARQLSMSGESDLAVSGPDGPTWVEGGLVTIPAGGSVTVTVHFVMPGAHGSMAVVPSARVPAEQWQFGGHTTTDDAPFTISW